MTAQTTAPAAPFVPAWFCDHEVFGLRWSNSRLGWELFSHGELIAALIGYPDGAPPNSEREARAWADSITSRPQQWIARPARSGANHTHANPDITCPPPIYVPDETEENPS